MTNLRKSLPGKIRFQLIHLIMAGLIISLLISACNHQPETSTLDIFVQHSSGITEQQTAPSFKQTTQSTGEKSITTTRLPSISAATLTPADQEPTATPKPTVKTPQTDAPTVEPTSAPTDPPTTATTTESRKAAGSRGELNEDFYWISLDADIKQRITGLSYPTDDSNIQIHYDDLRYIKLLHYDFTGDVHEGELIVHATLADEVMEIFYQLYLAEYPLTSVLLVDEFGQAADDTLSMEANNTSAFNYRFVTGTQTLSRHSFGAAIDINPMLNPYIVGDRIMPENGVQYADRSWDFPGKIDHDDLCYQLFKEKGWIWGGDWTGDKDYQHFSKQVQP